MVWKNTCNLPPGFRFHPTDEELIIYYLRNQATSRPCPVSIIPEVDIYKFDPWQLPEKAEFGEKEWYFFSPRDRKYPNGVRPNRAAVSGYWKATGTDKAIYSGNKYVGVKKALVFYIGKPPKGVKTDWIMHEYRLSESRSTPNKQNGSMRLDDWVLCRIYKKKRLVRTVDIKGEDSPSRHVLTDEEASDDHKAQALKLPRTWSISHMWEFDYLLNDNSYNPSFNNQNPINNLGALEKFQLIGGVSQQYYSDAMKSQESSTLSQPIYMDSAFGFE